MLNLPFPLHLSLLANLCLALIESSFGCLTSVKASCLISFGKTSSCLSLLVEFCFFVVCLQTFFLSLSFNLQFHVVFYCSSGTVSCFALLSCGGKTSSKTTVFVPFSLCENLSSLILHFHGCDGLFQLSFISITSLFLFLVAPFHVLHFFCCGKTSSKNHLCALLILG